MMIEQHPDVISEYFDKKFRKATDGLVHVPPLASLPFTPNLALSSLSFSEIIARLDQTLPLKGDPEEEQIRVISRALDPTDHYYIWAPLGFVANLIASHPRIALGGAGLLLVGGYTALSVAGITPRPFGIGQIELQPEGIYEAETPAAPAISVSEINPCPVTFQSEEDTLCFSEHDDDYKKAHPETGGFLASPRGQAQKEIGEKVLKITGEDGTFEPLDGKQLERFEEAKAADPFFDDRVKKWLEDFWENNPDESSYFDGNPEMVWTRKVVVTPDGEFQPAKDPYVFKLSTDRLELEIPATLVQPTLPVQRVAPTVAPRVLAPEVSIPEEEIEPTRPIGLPAGRPGIPVPPPPDILPTRPLPIRTLTPTLTPRPTPTPPYLREATATPSPQIRPRRPPEVVQPQLPQQPPGVAVAEVRYDINNDDRCDRGIDPPTDTLVRFFIIDSVTGGVTPIYRPTIGGIASIPLPAGYTFEVQDIGPLPPGVRIIRGSASGTSTRHEIALAVPAELCRGPIRISVTATPTSTPTSSPTPTPTRTETPRPTPTRSPTPTLDPPRPI